MKIVFVLFVVVVVFFKANESAFLVWQDFLPYSHALTPLYFPMSVSQGYTSGLCERCGESIIPLSYYVFGPLRTGL